MNRFTPNRTFSILNIWQIMSVFFIAGFIILFVAGIHSIDNTASEEQAKSLEKAIRRSVVQCYAVEGTYPPSLDYLREHYGLIYDNRTFYIDYTAIGSNIMPDITILPRSEDETGFMTIH